MRFFHIIALAAVTKQCRTRITYTDNSNNPVVMELPRNKYYIEIDNKIYVKTIKKIEYDCGAGWYTEIGREIYIDEEIEPGTYYFIVTVDYKERDRYGLSFPMDIGRNELGIPANNFPEALLMAALGYQNGLKFRNIVFGRSNLDVILKIYWELHGTVDGVEVIPPMICDSTDWNNANCVVPKKQEVNPNMKIGQNVTVKVPEYLIIKWIEISQ